MDFEGLAGSCVFELAIYIAFLDEKGGVVELYMKVSTGVQKFEHMKQLVLTFGTVCMAATNLNCEKCLGIR